MFSVRALRIAMPTPVDSSVSHEANRAYYLVGWPLPGDAPPQVIR